MHKILLSFIALALGGCFTLTANPGQFRDKKNVTVGYPGALWTTKSAGYGFKVGEPGNSKVTILSGHRGQEAFSINPEANTDDARSIHFSGWGFDAFALRFPWESSFFFVGSSMSFRRFRQAYNEHTAEFGLNQSTTNVEWVDSTIDAAIPIGISLNYDQQITTLAAIGPIKQVYRSRKFIEDGTGRGVDERTRDATITTFDDFKGQIGFYLMYMAGYSF